MNRVNFGRVSGVIVDVCKMHGTWFDAGELTAVFAFAANGGLERTRDRERLEKGEEKKRKQEDTVAHMQLAVMESRHSRYGGEARVEIWEEFLRALFSW
jgi:Zn-finger nucleic acid-binding protein